MTLLTLVYLILGACIIFYASGYAMRSLRYLARFFGVSGFTISFILMSLVTTIPELTVGITSAISGNPQISLGNAMGTNIVNLTFILGIVALVAGRTVMDDYQRFSSNRLFNFFLIMSPVILLLDGRLSRIDGAILLLFFMWSLLNMLEFRKKMRSVMFRGFSRTTIARAFRGVFESTRAFFRNLGVFILSAGALIIASYYFTIGARNTAESFGLSEILIGIFIVGLGTSMPELVFGVRAARAGQGGMSLGNLFGASIINSTLILGTTAIIVPVNIGDIVTFWIGVFFMAVSVLMAYYLLRSKVFLTRSEGLTLLLLYIIFIIVQGAV
jgi:cation:H+ antiporter